MRRKHLLTFARIMAYDICEYEEYAIHDTDNFPMEISEYTSIEELNRIYEQLEELPDYLLDNLDSFVSCYGKSVCP